MTSDAWNAFRDTALEWAKKRAEHPEDRDALDERFRAATDESTTLLQAHLTDIPRLLREIRLCYVELEIRRVTTHLRNLGRKRGRCFGRTLRLDDARRFETEARSFLASSPLDERTRLQHVFEQGVFQGRQERVAAERTAAEIHRLVGGYLPSALLARLWCRPEKLYSLLLSLERDIRRLAVHAYAERYERELRPVVLERFPGHIGAGLAAILEDKLREGIVSYLNFLAPSPLAVLRNVEKCIWQLPRYERRRIEAEFADSPSQHALQKKLPEELARALEKLLAGSWAEFEAHLLSYDLRTERHWSLIERLIACSSEERRQVARAFRACFDTELSAALQTRLTSEPLRELASALLRGDEGEILARRGRAIIESASEEWLGDLLRGRRRGAFIDAYRALFGADSLEVGIEERYFGRDREILNDILRTGKVAAGKLLWFAIGGIGTDERALIALLEDTPPETLSRMKHAYHEIWTERAPWYERLWPKLFGELHSRLWLECAGDNWCDLKELIHDDAALAPYPRLIRRYEHERSGTLLKSLEFFSREGRVMDRDVRVVEEFYRQADAGGPEAALQLASLIELAEADCSIFRSLKHFIGNSVTTATAGVGVFCAAYSLSVLDVEIFVVMAAVGATSAVLRFLLKRLLKGRGYHRDEMVADFAFAVVDGATLYLGRLFRQAAIRMGAGFTSRLGLKTSIVRFLRRLREVSAEVEAETLRELIDEDIEEPAWSEGLRVVDPQMRSALGYLYQVASAAR